MVFGYWGHAAVLRSATGHAFSIDGPVTKTVTAVPVTIVKMAFTEEENALLGGNARQDHSAFIIHATGVVAVQDIAKDTVVDGGVEWTILSAEGDGFDTGVRVLCRRKGT